MLWNQMSQHACCAAKPIFWHQVGVKENLGSTAGPSKENGQLILKRPKPLDDF